MKLQKALTYLDNVTKKSMAVPMRRYAGSTGRTAQGKCPREILHAGFVWWQRCQRVTWGGNCRHIAEYYDCVNVWRTLCVNFLEEFGGRLG